MRDFRFHIASLIAVFLALGVGIFIGYGIDLSTRMDPLRSQIAAIREQDETIKDENRQLHQDNDNINRMQQHLQNEVNRLTSLSIAGRLSGKNVSLISVGPPPRPELIDAIWNPLIQAGARRLNETFIHGSLLPPAERSQQEILARIHAAPDQSPTDAIMEAVAQTIGSGSDPTLLAALSHRGVPIDMAGAYGTPPDLIILLCQVDTHARLEDLESGDTMDTHLVRSFQSQQRRVIECERAGSVESGASYFRRLGLSSVDNVDTPEGGVSLVWASLGYSGHFGSRPGADSLLPGAPGP